MGPTANIELWGERERERPGDNGRDCTSKKKLGQLTPRIPPSWILTLHNHFSLVILFSFFFLHFNSTPGKSFKSLQLPNISNGKMTSWKSPIKVSIWNLRKQVWYHKNLGFPNMGCLENCRRESWHREIRVEEIFPCRGRSAKIWKIFLKQVGGWRSWLHVEREMERKESE